MRTGIVGGMQVGMHFVSVTSRVGCLCLLQCNSGLSSVVDESRRNDFEANAGR